MNPGQTAPIGRIPERIFEKVNFEKKLAEGLTTKNREKFLSCKYLKLTPASRPIIR